MPFFIHIPSAQEFEFGNCLKSNGGTNVITFPSITEMNSASQFSIHSWIDSDTGEIAVVGPTTGTANRFGFLKFSDDNLYVYANAAIGNINFTSYLGARTLVSVLFNAGSLSLYVNAVDVTPSLSGSVPSNLAATAGNNFKINSYDITSAYGNSKYDEISIVNGLTPDSEITNLYNSGNGAFANGTLSNLLENWRCNENDGATTLSGEEGNYNGTLNNFSTPPAYFISFV